MGTCNTVFPNCRHLFQEHTEYMLVSTKQTSVILNGLKWHGLHLLS